MDAILKLFDFKSIDSAAEKIFNADRIDIYGVGASGIAAPEPLLEIPKDWSQVYVQQGQPPTAYLCLRP